MRGRTNEITKLILKGILITGGVVVAATSPYFVSRVLPQIMRHISWKMETKRRKKKFSATFNYLKNKGLINIEYRGAQIYISLTPKGKRLANKYQIDDLKIKKPKKWDKKWRILIFDIKDRDKMKREALRGKIKELGLFQLQKSVWICPYGFQEEMNILRGFFRLTGAEMKTMIAYDIENDYEARKFFKI